MNRLLLILLMLSHAHVCGGTGIPEPGFTLYGVVLNRAAGPEGFNTVMTEGTLSWTIAPEGAEPVTITTSLTNINGLFSYVVDLPFESRMPGMSVSPGLALPLLAGGGSYDRSAVTVNGFPAAILSPASTNFVFDPARRGDVERLDLMVYVPYPDADGDGIPDWWEEANYGGPTNANADSLAANQRNTILEAYVADLDPANPSAMIPPLEFIAAVSNHVWLFNLEPTSPARLYEIAWTTNIHAGPLIWEGVSMAQTGSGHVLGFSITNDLFNRIYFRSRALLP